MICPYCGNECAENHAFCQNCGNRLPEKSAPAPQPQPEPSTIFTDPTLPPPAAPVMPTGSSVPYQQNGVGVPSAANALKQLARSKSCLTGIIAYTAAMILSLLGSFAFIGYFTTEIPYILEEWYNYFILHNETVASIVAEIYFVLVNGSTVGIGLCASAVFSGIPSALIIIGMWTARASAAKDTRGTGGLTLLKVISVINLIFRCLSLLFVAFLLIGVLSLGFVEGVVGSLYEAISITITVIVSFLVLLPAAILPVVYQAKVLKTLNVMRDTIVTDTPNSGVSSFVIFACWAMGIYHLLSFISSLSYMVISILFPGLYPEAAVAVSVFQPVIATLVLGALSTGLLGAAHIAFGIFLGKYKDTMNTLLRPQLWR